MKELIILIAIASIGCVTRPTGVNRMLYDETTQTMHVIPEECFDDEGNFDENLGHDTLDCGNLPQLQDGNK